MPARGAQVAAVCSVSVLALLAAVAPGANRTALVGWFAPGPYSSQWMQPQMPMQEMGPRLVQLAAQNVPRQLAVALPAAQGAGRSSAYIDGLGSTAATLEEQKKALDARKQQIEQQEQDVQHLYEAAVQAREENTARRAEEEQAAVSRDAQVHGLPWQQEMGTDISFIPTAQFPGSMKGAWHHNAPYVGGQGAQALPPAALASPPPPAAASLGANSPTASAALQALLSLFCSPTPPSPVSHRSCLLARVLSVSLSLSRARARYLYYRSRALSAPACQLAVAERGRQCARARPTGEQAIRGSSAVGEAERTEIF